MSHRPPFPLLLPLLLTILSSLLHSASAGGSISPGDFNTICLDAMPYPQNQQTFVDMDAYDSISTSSIFFHVGWTAMDDGFCDNSLTACSNDTNVASNRVLVNNFDPMFYVEDGTNDPLYIETSFTCSLCPNCTLRLTILDRDTLMPQDSIDYPCSEGSSALAYDYPNDPNDLNIFSYTAVFDDASTDLQSITIDRLRLYQYQDCPVRTFNLAIQSTSEDPGVGPVAGACVANAETMGGNMPEFGCSDLSQWEMFPGSESCLCSAGFEPDENLTACGACGPDSFKVTVSNDPCEMCPPRQVPNADNTGCVCAEQFSGNMCQDCAVDYFREPGGDCVICPDGSARADGEDVNFCTCTGNRVTAENEATITTSDACGLCAEGYDRVSGESLSGPCNDCDAEFFMMIEGQCIACPSGSSRETGDPQDRCDCDGGTVTSSGNNSTSDVNMPCETLVVTFSASAYTFPENEILTFFLSVEPPPTNEITLTVSISDPGVQDKTVILSSSQMTTSVSFEAFDDDSVALQSSRMYTVMFDTESTVDKSDNTAELIINDEDVVEAKFSQSLYLFGEGDGTVEVCVELTTEAAVEIIVKIEGVVLQETTAGAESAPELDGLDEQLVFQPMSTIECYDFEITDDSTVEDVDEQYRLSLVKVSPDDSAFTVSSEETTVAIRDDDGVVEAKFSQSRYSFGEGDGTGEVCVELTTEAAVEIIVKIEGVVVQETTAGAESAPELDGLDEQLVFQPMSTIECYDFEITDDSTVEDVDEQYRLSLVKVSPDDAAFTISSEETTVTIRDDDDPSTSLPLGVIIGVCVGGALLAVIAAILCLFCLCIWRLNVKRQGFYHTYEDSQTAPTMLRYSASLRSISSQSIVVAEGKRSVPKENEFFV